MQFKKFMEKLSEGAYEKSEENKRSADAAKKQGDMFAHHMHMADHHDNLAQWHGEKGRHGEADKHAEKAEQHHEKAMALKEEVELEESMTDSWKKVQSMDKGSVTGGKEGVRKRLDYLNAVHAHHKKYGNDTLKVRKEIENLNRSRLAEADTETRSDYKLDKAGRKSHKQIVFHDGTQNKELDDKLKREETEMQEEMTDAQKQERERLVKGMKKNIASFKSKYGTRAKEVMYATATKNAMKEDAELDEATDYTKLAAKHMKDALSRKSTPAQADYARKMHKRALAASKMSDAVAAHKHYMGVKKEEAAVLDEKSEQARKNKTMKNMMDASRGARWKVQNKMTGDDVRDWDGKHKTAQAQNKAIGRALRNEDLDEAKKDDTPPFDGPYKKVQGDGTVKDKSGAMHTPMSRARDLARQAMKKQMKEHFGVDITDEQADSLVEAANVSEELKGSQHKLDKNKNGKLDKHDFKLLRKEEAEQLEEAVESGNKGNGYHGQHDSEVADKKYSAMHAKVKKVAGEAGHLRDAKKPNVMVKHYLDSRHGRHLADNEHDHEYIKKDFGRFKKAYKPELHESVDFDEQGNLMSEKLKFSDFIAKINEQLLEYESDDSGVYRHTKKATYGTAYQGDDDEDEKPKKAPAEKRGRGRPAGSYGGSYKARSAETKAAAAAKAAATKAAKKK